MIKQLLLLILLLTSTSVLNASDFCYSKEWLNSLYYEPNGSGYKSLAEEDGFFVTKQGKNNPKIEYEKSLELTKDQNVQFKTKFPLRYKIITRHNQIKYDPSVKVSGSVDNVIIAYPNRYMSNPASMFGHLFLVLETDRGILDSDILHYIAQTDGDRSVGYMIKGLSGQYKGWFLREPYYRKIKNYNYVEDRDVIYYDLKLSSEQIEDLQLHYIELKNTYFYYYFIDKNCSFFIGKLLNVVIEPDIVTNRAYMMPSQIVNDLGDADLLVNERVRIANTKIFNSLFNSLSSSQQDQMSDLFKEKRETIEAEPDVLRAFIICSEYVISNYSYLADIIRFNRITAYQQLSDLRTSGVRQNNLQKEGFNKIQSESVGYSRSFSNYYQLSYNPVYFSEYDQFNKLEVISVKCFGSKINLYPNNTLGYQLDVLDLNNITQYNSVLNSYSWKFKSTFSYKDSIYANQEAYFGLAWNFMNRGLFYSLIGLNYANVNDVSGEELGNVKLLPTIKMGLNNNLTDSLKLLVSYENKFQKDYITTEFLYKLDSLLGKLVLVHNRDDMTSSLSFEYLY